MNTRRILGLVFAFSSFCKGEKQTCSSERCEELLAKIEKLECRLEYSRELLEDKIKKKEHPVPKQACAQCPDTWMQYNGSCYLFVATKYPFDEAKSHCRKHGSHLVRIENELENGFLKIQLRKLKEVDYWIGLTDADTEGIFKWVEGNATASFTDWNPGQPNNTGGKEHCAHFRSTFDYEWNDDLCSSLFNSICERKTNP